MAEVLHITPWDARDKLTVSEFRSAVAYLDERNERLGGE